MKKKQETLMWCSGDGGVNLAFTPGQVRRVCVSGENDHLIEDLRRYPSILTQVDALDDDVVREIIREYFADITEEELKDVEANVDRLLWMACWDLFENEDVEAPKQKEYYFAHIEEIYGEYETRSEFVMEVPKGELEDARERVSVEWRSGSKWDEVLGLYWFDCYAYKPVEVQKIKKSEYSVLRRFFPSL